MSKKSELEELKNLSPEQRIKKLKQLQEKGRKEIEQAQELIKQSEQEASQEKKLKQQIPIPQLKSVDIESLFSSEEKELFKTKRFEQEKEIIKKEKKQKEKPLEQTVFEEQEKFPEKEQETIQYGLELAKNPAAELRQRTENIYEQFKQTGEITYDQRKELEAIGYASVNKLDDIEAGSYEADKRVAQDMVVTQKIKNWLQDKYKGNSLYKN